jgi:hypothetical protein
MQSKKVIRYYADCGKGFWKKPAALAHDISCKCWTNPRNKTCKTCKYGEKIPYETDTGFGGGWQCNHLTHDEEHAGAPKDIKYISVKCNYYGNQQGE